MAALSNPKAAVHAHLCCSQLELALSAPALLLLLSANARFVRRAGEICCDDF
jgi:hypothetical protein